MREGGRGQSVRRLPVGAGPPTGQSGVQQGSDAFDVGPAGIDRWVRPEEDSVDPQAAQPYLLVVGDHHRIGSQAAVGDAHGVGGLESFGHFEGHDCCFLRTPPFREQFGPGVAGDPFGDDRQVVVGLDDIQHPDHPAVLHTGCVLGGRAKVGNPGMVQGDEAGAHWPAQGRICRAPHSGTGLFGH